jgi:hypothetical protein
VFLLAYGTLGKFLFLKIYAELLTASTPPTQKKEVIAIL